MNIEKELKDISLELSEEEYRNSSELHYSTISRYEEKGFNGLDHLFDPIESPSLTFGGVCDTLLTEGEQAFKDKYLVVDINLTDGGINTCKQLIEMHLPYSTFEEIPEQVVSTAAKQAGFYADDKYDKTRYQKVLKTGNIADYYQVLLSADKTVISTEMYNEATACVKALRESPATSGYFADDDPFSPIKRYYQLKFKADIDGVGYMVMADVIVVDYEKKIVYINDLKTMGFPEWNFEDNFLRFHYYQQARLYYRVIKANLDNDPYFKDFKIENFRFIVVNKNTLTPLVWEFPLTKAEGDLIDDKGNVIKDPCTLGKELKEYLDCRPQVPNGIIKDGINIINCLKKA